MKNKRIIKRLFLSAFVLLVLSLCGCSSDSLMQTSRALGKLGYAGLGTAGSSVVEGATKAVNGFVETYETSCITLDKLVEAKLNAAVSWITGFGSKEVPEAFTKLMETTVSSILEASETGYNDSALRAALNTKYSGKTSERPTYRNVDELLSSGAGGDSLKVIINSLHLFNVIHDDVYAKILLILKYDLPLPLQSYDFDLILSYLMKSFSVNRNGLIKKFKSISSSSSLSLDSLKNLPDSISAYVGDRNYQTLGDKIAVSCLLDAVIAATDLIDAYVKMCPEDKDAFEGLTLSWILKNCSASLDRVFADVNVIGYIYNVNINTTEIVSGIVSGK